MNIHAAKGLKLKDTVLSLLNRNLGRLKRTDTVLSLLNRNLGQNHHTHQAISITVSD